MNENTKLLAKCFEAIHDELDRQIHLGHFGLMETRRMIQYRMAEPTHQLAQLHDQEDIWSQSDDDWL